MSTINYLFILYLLIIWLIGLYVHTFQPWRKYLGENFDNQMTDEVNDGQKCPNLLVEKDGSILLYKTTEPTKTGINPIPFYNLEEYINYIEIQRKKGIDCNVLHLKHSTNSKNEDVYTNVNTGVERVLDANKDNPPFNQNLYHGFDPMGLHIGRITELDVIHASTANDEISDNAMDPNWGGVLHTERMIQIGKYDDRKVARPILPKTGTLQDPNTGRIAPASIFEQNYHVQ